MIRGFIYQTNDYYLFDTPFSNNPSDVSFQKYKYNGKELDRVHGLDLYDYGARNYDAIIGSWTTMDPLAERTPEVSPYVYCKDNPVNAIDIDRDSLAVKDAGTLKALINGFLNKQEGASMKFNNSVLDPNSIKEQAENSSDFFLKDLYEIAKSKVSMVDLSTVTNANYIDPEGKEQTVSWSENSSKEDDDKGNVLTVPTVQNDYSLGSTYIQLLKENHMKYGRTVVGCTGTTLLPSSNFVRRSTNNHIQIYIYASKNINIRTLGICHEFGHAILFLRGQPSGHDIGGPVDQFIYNDRTDKMAKRLGFDY